MDFTREPIIESVITPKEGCTLVVRSSKGTGQEEYFVDAVEIVTFGNSVFFRSRERPKAFLVPVSDYEILEVREARLVLKNVGIDRSIKIGGGREAPLRTVREPLHDKGERLPKSPEEAPAEPAEAPSASSSLEAKAYTALDKKRDRKRNYKRRRGREEPIAQDAEGFVDEQEGLSEDKVSDKPEKDVLSSLKLPTDGPSANVGIPTFSSLLPPPANLISDTIARYKENALFQGAFFLKEELEKKNFSDEEDEKGDSSDEKDDEHFQDLQQQENEKIELPNISLDYPKYLPPVESGVPTECSEEEISSPSEPLQDEDSESKEELKTKLFSEQPFSEGLEQPLEDVSTTFFASEVPPSEKAPKDPNEFTFESMDSLGDKNEKNEQAEDQKL